MERTPRMPLKLCAACKLDVTAMIPFIELCRTSIKRWIQIADYLSNLAVPKTTKNAYITVGENISLMTTRFCTAKITNRKDALKRYKISLHRRAEYRLKTVNYDDDVPAEDFMEQDDVKPASQLVRPPKIGQDDRTKALKMLCPECKIEFFDRTRFNSHIANLKLKSCGRCYKLVALKSFAEHAGTHNLRIFSCKTCYATFENQSTLTSHENKHVASSDCLVCHKSFKNVNMHMHKHKPVTCGCGKWFSNGTCYFNHKRICRSKELKTQKYICDYCQNEYPRKSALRMHIQITHMRRLQYQCEKCGKKFAFKAHMMEHYNTHDKVLDRFVCACGSKFSSRRGYQRHVINVHKNKN